MASEKLFSIMSENTIEKQQLFLAVAQIPEWWAGLLNRLSLILLRTWATSFQRSLKLNN